MQMSCVKKSVRTCNHITVQTNVVLKLEVTLNHTIMYRLLILDRNT